MIGARVLKSLFFWGLAAVLTASAYTDIVKIGRGGAQETSASIWKQRGAQEMSGRFGELDVSQEFPGDVGEIAVRQEISGEVGETVVLQEFPGEVGETVVFQEISGDIGEPDMPQSDDAQKQVAITFDDGPHPEFTKQLLDGLAKREVCATFFVIGKNIPGNEELIARMQQEGHLIGNHTYDHVKISDLSGTAACEQVEKTSALVREITGADTEFIRPPFGEWNKDMECSFTMIPVLWNVDPLDWTTKNTALIEERILREVEPGDIILLHDFYKSSVEAALDVVDALLAQGYEFVTVDELILE